MGGFGESSSRDLLTGRWIWVSLPRATFGIVVRDGRVVDAAPIARKSIGRPEREVADYYRRRGAVFVPLPDLTPLE